MASKGNPRSRQNGIVIQELNNEILIYDLKIHKAYCLNETSALVWRACDGTKSVMEISQSIGGKSKSPVTEDVVWLAIEELKKENLLSDSEEIKTKFEGLSRREVIKKIGLGAMIALPIILSLVAPTAAAAQSAVKCLAPGTGFGTFVLDPVTCAGNPATANAACCSGQQKTVVTGVNACENQCV